MLQHLKISNLALLREVTLEFGPGFTAVTGETGAGKSVLLGALNLLAGGRGDRSLVRAGAEACEVEAVLWLNKPETIDAVLEGLGLPRCEDGILVLCRTLGVNRAGKVRINGELATVRNLQDLGEAWIDFHGPGEPQKLLHARHQLALLDSYAKNRAERRAYREVYDAWVKAGAEIERLQNAAQLLPDEQEFLRDQIALIDALELSEESVERLERDHRQIVNGQELQEKGQALSEVLNGFEGVVERLAQGLQMARELVRLEPEKSGLADRIESVFLELEDLGRDVESLSEGGELDEETAERVVEQIEQWMSLRRKYGGSVESVLARRDEMSARLESQGDLVGTLERLEQARTDLETTMEKTGETLRQTRVKAAKALSKEALELLCKLGFEKGRFAIEIARESEFRPHGTSRCEYRFAPNPGTEPFALGKIASSGEIARVMLALKAVLARVDATPVLVFDEVDANVGGEAAAVVGRELSGLGEAHQVFCITHLPQVAAAAGAHFVVRKEQGDDYTAVKILDLGVERDARLDELSRMLGDRSSTSARQHAEALLGR